MAHNQLLKMQCESIEVVSVDGGENLLATRALFQEYRRLFGGEDLEKEGIAEEIAGLPWIYAAPYGDLLLARIDETAAGCIALKTRASAEGELKRMFVSPEFRGRGVGHALVRGALKRAWALGMKKVSLDTLPSMVQAQAIYTSLGFTPRLPYGGKSSDDTLFFEIERPKAHLLKKT